LNSENTTANKIPIVDDLNGIIKVAKYRYVLDKFEKHKNKFFGYPNISQTISEAIGINIIHAPHIMNPRDLNVL
jgi:hypothetical protein